MRRVFADTFYWIALLNPRDQAHNLAVSVSKGLGPDKGYSLTDCISMNVMRRDGLIEVLTNDEHFTQEGFSCLLRE